MLPTRPAGRWMYGYSEMPAGYYGAILGWLQSRHGWAAQEEWLSCSPGVITAMNIAIQTFTALGRPDHSTGAGLPAPLRIDPKQRASNREQPARSSRRQA